MRKLSILLVVLLIGFTFGNAQDVNTDPCDVKKFSLSIGAGMRNISEKLFKDVYGGSGISLNVDFGVRILKSLEIFLHTDYFSKDGETTFTGETTTLKITPIELGFRYLLSSKSCESKLIPYLGAGCGYYMYKEENAIGVVNEKKIGFFGEGGLRFYFIKSFFIDAKIKNIILKVENDIGNKIKLGGFAFMGGIGISF